MKTACVLISMLFFLFSLYSQTYYRSNSIGMTLEEIPPLAVRAHSWYTVILQTGEEDSAQVHTKELYHNGKLHTVWRKYFDEPGFFRETIEKGSQKEIYDFQNGRMVFQTVMDNSVITEKWEFLYDAENNPVSRRLIFPEDTQADVLYTTDKTGRLRSRLLNTPEESDLVIHGISENRYLLWYSAKDRAVYESYREGRLARLKNRQGSDIADWSYSYETDTYTRVSISRTIETHETYNYNDKLVVKTVKENGMRVYYEMSVYNDEGIDPLSKIVVENDVRKEWIYFYDGGKIMAEEEYINRQLVSRTSFHELGKTRYVYRQKRLSFIIEYDENDFVISTISSDTEGQE